MVQVHIVAVCDGDDFVILGQWAKLRREFILAATAAGYEAMMTGPDKPHG